MLRRSQRTAALMAAKRKASAVSPVEDRSIQPRSKRLRSPSGQPLPPPLSDDESKSEPVVADLLAELEDDVPEVLEDMDDCCKEEAEAEDGDARPRRSRPRPQSSQVARPVAVPIAPGETLGRIRLGWCCMWSHGEGNCKTTTATYVAKLSREAGLRKINDLIMFNHRSLLRHLEFCAANGIGSFRITSRLLPLFTHPKLGYKIEELPDADGIKQGFMECGEFARKHNIRTLFHPDQFCVLNSPKEDVVEATIRELEHHNMVAEWVNADVINIHGGGVYNDKALSLQRLRQNLRLLSPGLRRRLTLENDDRSYTPTDLLPLCEEEGVGFVYDVHHHRCNPCELSIEEASRAAVKTFGLPIKGMAAEEGGGDPERRVYRYNKEPMFHISSPRDGWNAKNPRPHHDFISPADWPECWDKLAAEGINLCVEIEAKMKEVAVLRVQDMQRAKKILPLP